MPLLLRPLNEVPGLGEAGWGLHDATSVYGYAGPVASQPGVSEEVVAAFTKELQDALRQRQVVSVFSRLHPLFDQRQLLGSAGLCVATGRTVSLDLTTPPSEQFARFRKDHRRGIRKLRALGLEVIEDSGFEHLDAFVEIYLASMRRVGAQPQYFFDREYFASLVKALRPVMRLFLVRHGSQFVAATLITACNGIIQGHLGGTIDHALRWAPDKLLIDEVRLWGIARGFRVFHHGGGVGAQEDSLFRFKAGFSDHTHDFWTWRWIVDPPAYRALCESGALLDGTSASAITSGFFPAYRASAPRSAAAGSGNLFRSGFASLLLGGFFAEGAASPLPHHRGAWTETTTELTEGICASKRAAHRSAI